MIDFVKQDVTAIFQKIVTVTYRSLQSPVCLSPVHVTPLCTADRQTRKALHRPLGCRLAGPVLLPVAGLALSGSGAVSLGGGRLQHVRTREGAAGNEGTPPTLSQEER